MKSFNVKLTVLTAVMALSIPAVAGTPTQDELAQQVTIRRTAYGVPHILAQNERAAGFGFAYAQAEDHIESIMKLILTARGEMAEHFGGEDNIRSDFRNRQYRVHARAAETYHRLDEDWRAMTEGFAEGLNYYIERHRSDLPEWVQPVTPHDVAAHGLTGVARFAFNRRRIVDRFLDRLEAGENAVVELDGEMGSNMWAFSPERTTSGNAILMGNPHQPWSMVATYYEAHITIPGKYNMYGSTFIGRPVLTTGFNGDLGWSHTVNYPDLEEIYALDLDPDRPDHYRFDGGAVPMRAEEAVVRIKDGDGMREERRTFWYTPLGPVIHRTESQVFVLKSVAWDEFRFYQQWYRLGQARRFEEFKDALEILAIPMFNICYADRAGNIFYLWNGTIPDIPHPPQTDTAVHARDSGDVWTRVHPLDELPQLTNPEGGYVMNSNSAPYFTNLYEPMDRADYPDHFPNNRFSLRSQNSMRLIHNDSKFSLEDIVALKHDMYVMLPERVKPDLIAALEASKEPDFAGAVSILNNWDNTVSRDSRGSTLFQEWWTIYADGQEPEDMFATQWDENHPLSTPRGLADAARAVEAFREAMNRATERWGRLDVAWGDVHRMQFGEKAGVDLAVGGADNDLGAFRIVRFRGGEDGRMRAYSGDSWVFVVEFADTPRAYTVVAYSQSGKEGSPHFADQAHLYADNKMKRAAFTEDEIEKQLIRAYHPGGE